MTKENPPLGFINLCYTFWSPRLFIIILLRLPRVILVQRVFLQINVDLYVYPHAQCTRCCALTAQLKIDS